MDLFPWIMGIAVTAFVIIFLVLIPIAIHDDNKFKNACHAKGGKVLSTKNRLYCVKPDTFIDVDTN